MELDHTQMRALQLASFYLAVAAGAQIQEQDPEGNWVKADQMSGPTLRDWSRFRVVRPSD